jgi:hypothetical protein
VFETIPRTIVSVKSISLTALVPVLTTLSFSIAAPGAFFEPVTNLIAVFINKIHTSRIGTAILKLVANAILVFIGKKPSLEIITGIS